MFCFLTVIVKSRILQDCSPSLTKTICSAFRYSLQRQRRQQSLPTHSRERVNTWR